MMDVSKKIYINDRDMGKVNFGMNIYIMEKEKLIRIVDDALYMVILIYKGSDGYKH